MDLTSTSSSTLPSLDDANSTSTGGLKRKRKQMASCDSCRSRKIKCDRADSSMNLQCSECVKRDIECKATYISERTNAVRNGKLIVQAKLLYGTRDSGQSTSTSDSSPSSTSDRQTISNSQTIIPAAGARLIDNELNNALTSHLIEIYIEVIHPQAPIIPLAQFQTNWNAVGHRTSLLSPAYRFLVQVMQAFAARYSDFPSIVGSTAPSLNQLRDSPVVDYSFYGKRRNEVCTSFKNRALTVADETAALRRVSYATTGALLMLEFLLNWDDPSLSAGRHLTVASIEHLRALVEGVNDELGEESEKQLSGNPLFWMVYSRDALSAALCNRTTCMNDDDIPILYELAVSPVVLNVAALVSSDDPKTLGGLMFLAIFNHLILGLRAFSNKTSIRPYSRNATFFENVRVAWAVIDESAQFCRTARTSITRANISSSVPEKRYEDLAAIATKFSFAVHQHIIVRLAAEEADGIKEQALVQLPLSTGRINYLEDLRSLEAESNGRFLVSIRRFISLIKTRGTRLLFFSSVTSEYLPAYLSHMLSASVIEESDGSRWTLLQKIGEVGDAIEILKLMSWCWGNYAESINEACLVLDQLKYQAQSTLQPHSNFHTSIYTQTNYQTNFDSTFQSLNYLNYFNSPSNSSEQQRLFNSSVLPPTFTRDEQPPTNSTNLDSHLYQSNFPPQLNSPFNQYQQVQHRSISSPLSPLDTIFDENTSQNLPPITSPHQTFLSTHHSIPLSNSSISPFLDTQDTDLDNINTFTVPPTNLAPFSSINHQAVFQAQSQPQPKSLHPKF